MLAVIGLSITDVESFAQRQPAGERLSLTRSGSFDPCFLSTTELVRFQFIQGRLCLNCPQHRKGTQSRDEPGLHESIAVTSEQGIPSLHYVFQTAEQHLTLNVQHAGKVRLESQCLQTGERVILEQPAIGMVRCFRTGSRWSDQFEGSTLLHVRQQDPDGFDQHFGPLISCLLRGRSLSAITRETSLAMLAQARRGGTPTCVQIESMIDLLSAPTVAQRSHAHRQLLKWGTPVIPVLQALTSDELDAEQRARLGDIRFRLWSCLDDTPASLAKLLVNDKSYWEVIVHQLNEEQVRLADRHLVHFGVSPLAPVTTAEHRVAATPETNLR